MLGNIRPATASELCGMRGTVGTAWVPDDVLKRMIAEAERTLPFETGGVLLGYWAASDQVVLTDSIGPGPRALHRKGSFVPDPSYHENGIARVYAESGCRYTYLGDWHTHPKSIPRMSRLDRGTLRRISTYSPARAPVALMAILGGRSDWELHIWRYANRAGMLRLCRTAPLSVRIFARL